MKPKHYAFRRWLHTPLLINPLKYDDWCLRMWKMDNFHGGSPFGSTHPGFWWQKKVYYKREFFSWICLGWTQRITPNKTWSVFLTDFFGVWLIVIVWICLNTCVKACLRSFFSPTKKLDRSEDHNKVLLAVGSTQTSSPFVGERDASWCWTGWKLIEHLESVKHVKNVCVCVELRSLQRNVILLG